MYAIEGMRKSCKRNGVGESPICRAGVSKPIPNPYEAHSPPQRGGLLYPITYPPKLKASIDRACKHLGSTYTSSIFRNKRIFLDRRSFSSFSAYPHIQGKYSTQRDYRRYFAKSFPHSRRERYFALFLVFGNTPP